MKLKINATTKGIAYGYGSMNFLGKEDHEDNLMRVCSKTIAAELLEMTFGEPKHYGEQM